MIISHVAFGVKMRLLLVLGLIGRIVKFVAGQKVILIIF